MKRIIPVAVAVTLVGSGVFAAIPSTSGTIKGCYDQQGNLRVIDEAAQCALGEKPLTWGQGPAAGVSVTALVDYSPAASKYTMASWYEWSMRTPLVTLPPGRYAFTGNARVYHVMPGSLYCELRVNSRLAQQVFDDFTALTPHTLVEDERAIVGVIENTSAGDWVIELACDGDGQFSLYDIDLNVTRIDQLTVAPHPL